MISLLKHEIEIVFAFYIICLICHRLSKSLLLEHKDLPKLTWSQICFGEDDLATHRAIASAALPWLIWQNILTFAPEA